MPYAVTKAAQLQLVKCLAVTVGPKIRVNTVLPGLLLTEWVSYSHLIDSLLSYLCTTPSLVLCHPAASAHLVFQSWISMV
jgi:NAD(P)-dependent dehydrogenase (short-subunit alcohol dehydrogenase family)